MVASHAVMKETLMNLNVCSLIPIHTAPKTFEERLLVVFPVVISRGLFVAY